MSTPTYRPFGDQYGEPDSRQDDHDAMDAEHAPSATTCARCYSDDASRLGNDYLECRQCGHGWVAAKTHDTSDAVAGVEHWATRDRHGDVVEWRSEEEARTYVQRRAILGVAEPDAERVLHRVVPAWTDVTSAP